MMAKKIPMRMCVACREMTPKRELIRVVRSPEGEISIDDRGKKNGRGAYVCNKIECIENAIKRKQLERALDANVPDEIKQALIENAAGGTGGK
ncbi:MAG: YlxR family protein [Christensenellaceae bacterium]|nr:YlxR family protein [Christensenellaceae bacterium]